MYINLLNSVVQSSMSGVIVDNDILYLYLTPWFPWTSPGLNILRINQFVLCMIFVRHLVWDINQKMSINIHISLTCHHSTQFLTSLSSLCLLDHQWIHPHIFSFPAAVVCPVALLLEFSFTPSFPHMVSLKTSYGQEPHNEKNSHDYVEVCDDHSRNKFSLFFNPRGEFCRQNNKMDDRLEFVP